MLLALGAERHHPCVKPVRRIVARTDRRKSRGAPASRSLALDALASVAWSCDRRGGIAFLRTLYPEQHDWSGALRNMISESSEHMSLPIPSLRTFRSAVFLHPLPEQCEDCDADRSNLTAVGTQLLCLFQPSSFFSPSMFVNGLDFSSFGRQFTTLLKNNSASSLSLSFSSLAFVPRSLTWGRRPSMQQARCCCSHRNSCDPTTR